jgi:hypothetical protein
MNESGIHLMEWTPELGQRPETKLDFVVHPSDLVFGDPSFVIRQAGVYSELGKVYPMAQAERNSMLAPLIRNSDDFRGGTVDAMAEPANESPPDDRAVALQPLGERRLAWKPTLWRAIATAKSAEMAFELSGQEWPSPALP